ncbi:MAG: HDIG domain-containing protein [Thermoplasmata archaeon]|nr:MAG: HDIG domain-containing protein [Thermoplasmata archaeon]
MGDSDIYGLIPEIDRIGDHGLREMVARVWDVALERSAFDDLAGIPFTLLIEDLDDTLIEHTGRVTKAAMAAAKARGDLDMDTVIAGAILHDVGKVLEYQPAPDGTVVKSEMGKRLRHPVSGAALAQELGLPLAIVHIIAAHAGEGNMVTRTPEAILIHHSDMTDFEITKARLGRGGAAPTPK